MPFTLVLLHKTTYRSCISQVMQKDCVIRKGLHHQQEDSRETHLPSGQAKNSGFLGHSMHIYASFPIEKVQTTCDPGLRR